MFCKKCDAHRWQPKQPEDIVHRDELTKEDYCIFHAPVGCKKDKKGNQISVQMFNQLVFLKIQEDSSKGSDQRCNLGGVIFPGEIDFSKFKPETESLNIGLQGSIFTEDVSFRGRKMDASFDGCRFMGKADFSGVEFLEIASFHSSVFTGVAHFTKAQFPKGGLFAASTFEKKAWFNECIFGGDIILSPITAEPHAIRMHDLSRASLGNVLLTSHEVSSFSFSGCTVWPDDFGFESNKDTPPIKREELYRAMKLNAVNEHDHRQASHWHYLEKQMVLKRGDSGKFEQLLLWLYYHVAGFGERAVRAGVCLVILVGLFFLANITPQPWDWSALPGSDAANATMATIPFAKDIPGDGWVKVGRCLFWGLILAQSSFFAKSVFNRFRR